MKMFLLGVFFVVVLVIEAQKVVTTYGPGDCQRPYILVEKYPGVYILEDITGSKTLTEVIQSDIKILFYSKTNPQLGKEVNFQNYNKTSYDPSKETIFIIHGWRSDSNSTMPITIREALLKVKDANIFVVDWAPYASKNYLTARYSITGVADIVATYLNYLINARSLDLGRTWIVGHSLGAHITGIIGALVGGKLDHIVGLDPAWPLFVLANRDDRLDETDARFVQIIHTNGGILGYPVSIGTADYYPNGGERQKGCGIDLAGSCSHSRSYYYFAESITRKFPATMCDNYKNFEGKLCMGKNKSFMGGDDIDKSARGSYYLDTNSQPPYSESN